MKYLFVFLLVVLCSKILSGQTSAYDSLIQTKLPYDTSEISICFKGIVINDMADSIDPILLIDQWIGEKQENGSILDMEKSEIFKRSANLFADIKMTKKNIPIKMLYTIDFKVLSKGFEYKIYHIYYQNYPTEKKDEKIWITAAEEAILDTYLYNKKGKLNKLRGEYKYETLLMIDVIEEELNEILK